MNKFILILLAFLLSACDIQVPPDPTPDPEPTPEPSGYVRPLPKPVPEWAQVPTITDPLHVCNNGDDNNPGTEQEPLASFSVAMEQFVDGRDVLFCYGGSWEHLADKGGVNLVGKNKGSDDYVYMGAYGDESLGRPHFRFSHGFFFEGAQRFYFHNLDFEGDGYTKDDSIGSAFFMWDNVKYIVINKVKIHEYALGINASEGRIDNVAAGGELRNTHLAVINSEGYWNRKGFFLGAFSDQTFISNNYAEYNGGYGGAHNYYLAGEVRSKTKNYVFQLNESHNSSPKNGKDGGNCSRGAIVAHGYIENLYFVDNKIIEQKGNTDLGCWGAPVDYGRGPEWGVEHFPDLTYTGNHAEYTGGLLLGLTNAPGALVGWNTGILDASLQAVGFAAPNKHAGPEDQETKVNDLTIVYNNFHIDSEDVLWNTAGIKLGIPDYILEHNTVTYSTPQDNVYCYWIQGEEPHTLFKGNTEETTYFMETNSCGLKRPN